jgi:glycerophosphoryl diester phosphodiesterase
MRRFLIHSFVLIYAICFQAFGQEITIRSVFEDTNKRVLVAAHRGDWITYPENSIPAVLSCIENGVDIVEVDVQRTRDGHYVLMHDGTVNRTTNGRGSVSAYSLESITKLRLKNKAGELTEYTVPTLDTILKLTKGKILVNLDKSAGRFNELIPIIDSLGCGEHVILKGTGPAGFFRTLYQTDSIGAYYMPIVSSTKKDIDTFLILSKSPLVEFLLSSDTTYYSRPEGLEMFRRNGTRIWYNALFNTISGGHNEAFNARDSWNWFIEHDAYIIQTDYPFFLLRYLADRGLRPQQPYYQNFDLSKLPNKVPKPKPEEKPVVNPEEKPVNPEVPVVEQVVEPPKELPKEQPKPKPKPKPVNKYYIVKKGDTLTHIALRHKLSLKELLKLNRDLSMTSVLQIGQKIRVK